MNRELVVGTLLLLACMIGQDRLSAQEEKASNISFSNPIVSQGAETSLVGHIESAVIIPGCAHENLWVHPNLVTEPGNPIVIELRLRPTDRKGHDRHRVFVYFRTEDLFQTLTPIDQPTIPAWKRIGLTNKDFEASSNPALKLSGRPVGSWHWARNYIHIDSATIMQPFLTIDGDRRSVQTVVARVEEERLVPLYLSNSWSNAAGRGLLEPQIAEYQGRYFMTLRAEDKRGYVMVSDNDGRSWSRPKPWTWDHGDEIPMHSTMTKLLSHSDGLTLVYTRIRDDNGNVMRHRAPLHIADVDPETLSLKRSTERIIVPNKSKRGSGLPLGNFWVWPINQQESHVVVAQWPRDDRKENGDTWLAKILWKRPNKRLTSQGHKLATMKMHSPPPL